MLGRVALTVLSEFEAPDVVAQVQPGHESRFAQLHQIAVDRGAVEVERLKGSRNFGVTEWACGTQQFSQDREARGRAAETKSLNARAQCLALGAPLRGCHETAFCQTAKSPRASAFERSLLAVSPSNGWSSGSLTKVRSGWHLKLESSSGRASDGKESSLNSVKRASEYR